MTYNYQCYDYPAQWYNASDTINPCQCYEGYIAKIGSEDSEICVKCPNKNCLSCDPTNPEICLNCASGHMLKDGKCFDCTKADFDDVGCPLAYKFLPYNKNLSATQMDEQIYLKDFNSTKMEFDIDSRVIKLWGGIDQKLDATGQKIFDKKY
jgi:hypothetical protein